MDDTEILSALTLSRLPRLSQPQVIVLMRHYGSAGAALADTAPSGERWALALRDRAALATARARAVEEYEYCCRHGIRVIPYGTEEYPLLLTGDDMPDAPPVLFYRGTGALNRRHVLSVVGTRRITDYGKDLCRHLLADLARLVPDVLIVSGLAYGVDIHAHRAALAVGLDTVAVLAHGHDRLYPALHRATADEMTRHGGLLTEYFTHTVPDKGNFVRRNRIVAALSQATLVIESAAKGGALITARLAMGYGREVMAVPGRVGDTYSEGCNRLIRENCASLVTSAADIVNLLGWQSVAANAASEPSLFPDYTPEQEQLIDLLAREGTVGIDRLVTLTGEAVNVLSDRLFDLEESGAVKRLPGNRFKLNL